MRRHLYHCSVLQIAQLTSLKVKQKNKDRLGGSCMVRNFAEAEVGWRRNRVWHKRQPRLSVYVASLPVRSLWTVTGEPVQLDLRNL